LPCVAQQLASDYIWAMHQIIAQTVAWPVDFPYRCPVGNAGVKFRASVEALPIAHFPMMPRDVNRQGSVAAI